MNRKERRAQRSEQHAFVKALPDTLTPIPPEEFPPVEPMPIRAWRSRHYLAQVYAAGSIAYPSLIRLSICRTRIQVGGRWEARLTWDELMQIKRDVGLGDWYGVEVYPRDKDIVNDANMRHLWLMPTPLMIGWER